MKNYRRLIVLTIILVLINEFLVKDVYAKNYLNILFNINQQEIPDEVEVDFNQLRIQEFINTAENEVGNVGGQKYIEWYGLSGHHSWCCIFISWCGNQCGFIEEDILPKFASVKRGEAYFQRAGMWVEKDNLPEPGMLIFFDFADENLVAGNLDGIPDHCGIIKDVRDGKIYCIEGNRNNVCCLTEYDLNSPFINGYVKLRFE